MSITLTTPLNFEPGHGLPMEVYNEVSIVDFHVKLRQKEMKVLVEYGNTNAGGIWVPGKAEKGCVVIRNIPAYEDAAGVQHLDDPQFDIIVGTQIVQAAEVGARIYDIVGLHLYQWLVDNGYYPGTVNV